jgi:drug/metabolite transporter (DMT)-like permease
MTKKLFGELTMFTSSLFFAAVAVTVKLLSGAFSGPFIALARFSIGIIMAAGLIIIARKGFKIRNKKDWLLRGLFGGLAMTLFYISLQLTSAGRAVLFNETMPLFVALFGFLFFKDKITWYNIAGGVICTAGMFFIFYDHSSYSIWGNIAGILCAVFSGIAVHYVRRTAQKNNVMSVYLSACLFGFVFCFFSFPEAGHLTLKSIPLLLVVGAGTFVAQMFMGYGYRHTPALKASIIDMSEIPMVILFSMFLGEKFTGRFFYGAGIIILGLLVNQGIVKIPGLRVKAQPGINDQ